MLSINFSPFPLLESDRLLFRRVDKNDVNEMFALRSNPETMKYVPRPLVKTHEDTIAHIELIESKIINNEGINWAITLKDNPKLIGIIGFYKVAPEHYRSEIGYMLLPEHNGQGIITEAVSRLIEYGFKEMKLHSIEAIIDPDNIASAKVLEKNNFVKEAHLKENEFYNGKFIDTVIYSLLNR